MEKNFPVMLSVHLFHRISHITDVKELLDTIEK